MSATLKELAQAYMMNEIYEHDGLWRHMFNSEFLTDKQIMEIMHNIEWMKFTQRKRKELLDNWCYSKFGKDYDTLMSWVGEEDGN